MPCAGQALHRAQRGVLRDGQPNAPCAAFRDHYDTMLLNLDTRKNSYASKAHEAASLVLCSIAERKGDMLR